MFANSLHVLFSCVKNSSEEAKSLAMRCQFFFKLMVDSWFGVRLAPPMKWFRLESQPTLMAKGPSIFSSLSTAVFWHESGAISGFSV